MLDEGADARVEANAAAGVDDRVDEGECRTDDKERGADRRDG